MKSRKDATTGGFISEYGILLVKKTMELQTVLAGFHTNNEFFQHCLTMHTSETDEPAESTRGRL